MFKKHFLNNIKKSRQLNVLLVIVLVAGIGTYLLIGSHAASPYASTTADVGSVGGVAASQPCTGASDGNCVVFGGSSGGTSQTGCFSSPGKCGYPDPNYAWPTSANAWALTGEDGGVGPTNAAGNQSVSCSSLKQFSWSNIGATFPAGSYYYSGSGNQIELNASNVNISGWDLGNMVIYVEPGSNNFTMDNDCMEVDGNGVVTQFAIIVPSGTSGLTIEHSSLGGANNTSQALGTVIDDFSTNMIEKNNYIYNAGGASNEYQGSGVIENNYEITNALPLGTPNTSLAGGGSASGSATNGSNVISGLSSTSGMVVGDGITGPGLPYAWPGTFIASINSGAGQVTVTNAASGGSPVDATSTGSGTYEFGTQGYSHNEDIECSDGTYTIAHNTLLNNQDETATIFCDTHNGQGGACDNHLTVTDDFLVGGDYTIQPCGNASSVGSSTIDVTDNRFARCLGSTTSGPDGTTLCSGLALTNNDGHGYYPNDGSYGPVSQFYTGSGQTWTGNYWDDNLQPVNE